MTVKSPSLASALLLAQLLAALPLAAEDQPAEPAEADTSEPVAEGERLPSTSVTRHQVEIGGRTLRFTATAGALTLASPGDEPEADIAYVAYALEGDAAPDRPVTFVVNGGPGASSAYLHLGVIGPWLLPMEGGSISPSQPIALEPNPDTWLAFSDLVFVDPVGTGFSRLVDASDRLRDRYLSVKGDIDALARFVVAWLRENGRLGAPTYFVGESYGGFRGPLVAEALQTEHGVGLAGMALISPVLDFGWWQQPEHTPLSAVALLPSLAAAAMERAGRYDRDALEEAEAYASGAFVTDFLRGLGDGEAVARMTGAIAEITDLPAATVEDYAGRLGSEAFTRELFRGEGRIASPYDAGISSLDPEPHRPFSRAADPVLDAMTAPLTSAMLALYGETLNWAPERRYMLLNAGVNRSWDWNAGLGQPEALGALGRVMALDPEFELLVVHGTADLVTPYFASELLLRQLPPAVEARVTRENYRGGHMFYTRAESRRAFAEAGRRLYGAAGG
jgi:carboxypeptidase C (cathepsin A)